MRILILGGNGMLGHQLLLTLQKKHEVRVTLRQDLEKYKKHGFFNAINSYTNIDIQQKQSVMNVLNDFQPDAVINCVGIIKQLKQAKESIPSIEINALFPHQLALLCQQVKARMIHISTDCVFSGKKGNYTEDDCSDAEDLYGKTKYLGEVHDTHCITLRTSIIGLELDKNASLIGWFLAQIGIIKGFKRAIYTGLTTMEMSRVIEKVLTQHPTLSGVWHIAADQAINKFDLLTELARLLNRNDIKIEPENDFSCDRSLSAARFNETTNYKAPSWKFMLAELAEHIKQKESEVCH